MKKLSIGNRSQTINESMTMKRIYSFMFAAVAAFAAASCAQELENNQVPAGETVTFTAVADGVDTKAALNEGTKYSEWEAGDAITVHNGTKGFEFKTEKAGSRATFSYTGNDFGGEKFLAVYPSGKSFDVANKVVKAYIPTWQQAKAGTYNHAAAVAVAYSENDLFNFKNATALLKFTVNTDNVTHVVFHGNGSEAITGDVNITLGEEGVETVQCLETEFTEDKWNEETQQNDKITVNKYGTWVECYAWDDNSLVDDPSDDTKYFTKGQTYYIAVAPQVFDGGVTVKFRIDKGEELVVKTTAKKVETKINTILNLGELEYVAPVVETVETIYLKPGVWAADDAWFWAHFFGSGGEADVKMTGPDANGMYQADVPAGMEKVLFCRMNPTWSEFSWDVTEGETLVEDRVWNQTGDLTVPFEGDDRFYYVITGWDTESTWMNYEDATYVAPEWTIAGTFNEWNTAAALVQSGDYFVAEDLVLYGAEFKILHNGEWLGYGAVAVDTWATFNGGDNITVMDAAAGKTYDVYVNPAKNKFVVVANGMSVPAESADVWGVCGTFTNNWGISNNVHMTPRADGWYTLEGVEIYKDDQFKFVTNDSWDGSLGANGAVLTAESGTEYDLVVGDGQNIQVSTNGVFTIRLNPATKKFTVTCTEEYTGTVNITVDNKANWNPLYITLWNGETEIVTNAAVTGNTYAVSKNYIGSTLTCQFSNGSKKSDKMNISITRDGATVTLEETIIKLYVQLDTDNSKQWWGNTMKIYVWDTGTSFDTSWPGNTMTSEGNYTWSIIVPSELVGKTINYLVHNGNGWQSPDAQVTISASGNTVTGSSIGIN